jgi:hypothetical protein
MQRNWRSGGDNQNILMGLGVETESNCESEYLMTRTTATADVADNDDNDYKIPLQIQAPKTR